MAGRNNKKILRIRRRYEYGDDLNKLSIECKVPLSTVNKRKAADADRGDPWIKNSKTLLCYKAYVEGVEERKDLLLKQITDRAREMAFHLDNLMEEKERDEACKISDPEEKALLYKVQEDAYLARSTFIEKYIDLRRKIEDIKTDEELLEYETKRVNVELKKLEVEERRLNLRIKRAENKRLLRRSEKYAPDEDMSKVPEQI